MSHPFYARCLMLLLLCVPFGLSGQKTAKVRAGELTPSPKGYELDALFGTEEASFYALRKNRRKKLPYILQKVSTDSLSVLESKTFDFPGFQGNTPLLESVFSIGRHNYLIATSHDSGTDSVYVLAYEIGDPVGISEQPVVLVKGLGRTLSRKRGYRVFKDPVNRVFSVLLPAESQPEKNEKFEIFLFDENLSLLKQKLLEVPYTSNILTYEDALVDSSGAIYVLTSLTNTSLTAVNEDRNIGKDFSLFKYSWATETLSEKSLSLGSKWLYDVKLLVNSEGNIQATGYYSNMVDLIMAGTFSLVLDRNTGDIVSQGLSPFDRDFRLRFRQSGSNITETQLGKFQLKNAFSLPGARTMLLSEKNYTESTTLLNPATGTYTIVTVFNYDAVLISMIDASSKIEHNLYIPKFQSSTDSQNSYTSYLAFRGKENTYVVYNDDRRNADQALNAEKGYRQLTTSTNAEAMVVEISPGGSMQKHPLFNPSEIREVFNPHFYYKTEGAAILVATLGYETRYFRLELK